MVIRTVIIFLCSLVFITLYPKESWQLLAVGAVVCTARTLICYSHPREVECIGGLKSTMQYALRI